MRDNTQLRPAGFIVIEDRESDRKIELSTLQCVHCGGHFWLVKPSKTNLGTTPGTCWTCGGPICGQHACEHHVPQEQQLENAEAGRALDFVPVRVAFAGAAPQTAQQLWPAKKLWLPD